jgi:predicted RNA-binding Zn ribbon-like protein
MPVEWNAHRFSGGALALSAANTVVHRSDALKRFDRFDDENELPRFAAAAARHCAEEFAHRPIVVFDPPAARMAIVKLREAIDRLFRDVAAGSTADSGVLADLLEASASAIRASAIEITADRPVGCAGDGPVPLEAAMAVSALALLRAEALARIKICPNCGWLFVDRSRNSSRLWCDMAVCGNRAKARRHYGKARGREAEA